MSSKNDTKKCSPIVKHELSFEGVELSNYNELLGKTTVPQGIHTSTYCIIIIDFVLEFSYIDFLHFNVQSQNFNFT